MSRYGFAQIVTNAETLRDNDTDLCDTKGYSLGYWVDYGVIGWDKPSSTYFIQLDNGSDTPPWWLGIMPEEIATPEFLCEIINAIFDVPKGTFDFNTQTISKN